MRFSKLALAGATLGLLASPAMAEEVAVAAAQPPAAPAPMEGAAPAPDTTEAAPVAAATQRPASRIQLGPVGHDAQGREGRIHVVQQGDTLWDVSDAYLGTPWVWPGIWRDNGDIENPHLIHPGDRLWISSHEIRRVTEEEAAEMLANGPAPEMVDAVAEAELPVEEMPASIEDPDVIPMFDAPRPTYRYSEIQMTGFVSEDERKGAATIIGAMDDRWMLDTSLWVVIGLGEGETQVGDQFEVFRTSRKIYDPKTGQPFGYATEQLGWLEVTEVLPDSARAEVRLARDGMEVGDLLRPRRRRNIDIEVGLRPEVEGHVVFTENGRMEVGSTDIVYLNRGLADGLAVGSPLEIYRPMGEGYDDVREKSLAMGDLVVAKLIVVEAEDHGAVAVVTHTKGAVAHGDLFRGSDTIAP